VAKSRADALAERLHAQGLRKQVAKKVADTVGGARSRAKPPSRVNKVVADLRNLASEIEDRATNGPEKRKAAAKKAAATRKRNAAKRSTAAKKGAATRARAASKGTTAKRSASTRTRAKAKSR
jgi:hypothetical protein